MATQHAQMRTSFRRPIGKGILATALFTLVAILIECLIVLYAISLGVSDRVPIIFTWPTTIVISPLFHIVPIAVIIALVACWVYLTRRMPIGPLEQKTATKPQKHPKASVAKTEQKPTQTGWQRIRQQRRGIKTALIVALFFLLFTLMVTVLAYPQIIYSTIASGYQSNPGLVNSVSSVNNAIQGFNQATGPLGGIATAINNMIRLLSPGIGAAGTALGNILTPLATIDSAGKYLAIQNFAAWITALAVIFYTRYTRGPHRYRRK